MKLTKSELDKIKLATATQAALDLFEKSKGERIVLDTPEGYHIELDGTEVYEVIKDGRSSLAAIDKVAFNESYRYLKHAEEMLNTQTAEGYSDCKTNCRCALISALKTLTGKEDVRQAANELGKQGILGEREEELIESFGELLVKLHGLASKGGPHPPMTTERDDAELVFSITSSIVSYVTNRPTKQRG